MASFDCRRFEEALASGNRPDDALSEHARSCPRCRALAEIAALRISPVSAADEDPALRSIHAAAAGAAARNADRWQRRRRNVPLVIGLAGYLIAASAALSALHPGVIAPAIPAPFLGAMQVAVPTPSLGEIAAAFAGSAVWTAVVALVARDRRQVTRGTAGSA
jgi:hypothetical protein